MYYANEMMVINTKNNYVSNNHSKDDALYHGYGLQNIDIITQKYNGTFTTFIEDDYYYAVCSVPLTEAILQLF